MNKTPFSVLVQRELGRGPKTAHDIVEATGYPSRYVHAYLTTCAKDGRVRRGRKVRSGHWLNPVQTYLAPQRRVKSYTMSDDVVRTRLDPDEVTP